MENYYLFAIINISDKAHFDDENLDAYFSANQRTLRAVPLGTKIVIECSNNSKLKKFPLKILYKHFPNISSIECYNNFNLKYFDGDLSVFNSLEKFTCMNCVNLEVFPEKLPPNIKSLNVINLKKIKSFPTGIFKGNATVSGTGNATVSGSGTSSGSLQNFVCGSMRELVSLPVDFGIHKSTIKSVTITSNKNLTSISDNFFEGCSSLEEIVFNCNNSLRTLKNITLPASVKHIKVLRNRSLQDFPVFKKENSLLSIQFLNNKKTIPFSFEHINSSIIKEISLSNVDIKEKLPSFEKLEVFILRDSSLTDFSILPKSLSHFGYSRNNTSSFRIDDIFKKISHLKNLKVIEIVGFPELKAIPDHFFSDFSFLEMINFSKNDIQEIPIAILNLKIENLKLPFEFGLNYNMKQPSEIILNHITQKRQGITGFYTDNENTHTSSFQKYYKKAVEKLLKEYPVETLEIGAETLQLNDNQKISFEEVKRAVEKKIASHPDRQEIEKIISTEVNSDVCISGKIIQLMKCLEGFFEKEEDEKQEELLSVEQRISSILNYIITVKKVTNIDDIRREMYEERGFENKKEFIEQILESIF